MQSTEKRIAALENRRGAGLEALTDDELDARIAALKERIALEEAVQAADPMEAVQHAQH